MRGVALLSHLVPDRYTLHVTAPDAARGVVLAAQPNGVWLWGLGHAVNPSLVFLQPIASAFHAKSRPAAAHPEGDASALIIPTAPEKFRHRQANVLGDLP